MIMPNWCTTNINIYNDDQKKLELFANKIEEWTSKNYIKSDFGLNWLGNIVGNSGIDTWDGRDFKEVSCRGTLVYHSVNDGYITIQTETAWSPMLLMWQKLIDTYIPDSTLYYSAEEFGNGILDTNDPDVSNTYVIDAWGDVDVESDWEASEGTVREVLQELLNTEENDIDKLIKMFEDSEYSDEMSIQKYDYVEADAYMN